MEELPFLYVHGPTFWRLTSIGLAVLVLAAIWGIRYLMARIEVRARVRRVRANHRAIRGVLRGDATSVQIGSSHARHETLTLSPAFLDNHASWRSDTLWLETPERTIELVGPVAVLAGTGYHAKRRALPAALGPSRRAAIEEQLPWVSSKGVIGTAVAVHVDAGDEVEVRGVLEAKAGQGEAGPREADVAWTMRGEGEGPLQIAAISPAIARVPLGVLRAAIVIGVVIALSTFTQRRLAEGWQAECNALEGETEEADRPIELGNGHPCVLAASVPDDRSWRIGHLHRYLVDHRYRDPATVARLDAVARDAETCTERVPQLFYSQRFEVAIEEAARCGPELDWYRHEALVMLGRFEEAADLPVHSREGGHTPVPLVSTLIAAGRWDKAAALVRAEKISDEYADLRTYRGCLADWLGHLAGEGDATARLRALAATDPPSSAAVVCGAILSELEPARRMFWLGIARPGSSVLTAAAGATNFDLMGRPEDVLLQPEHTSIYDAAALWLLPGGDAEWQRITRQRWLAVKQTLDNQPEAALATARGVIAAIDAHQPAQLTDDASDAEIQAKVMMAALADYRRPVALVHAVQLYTPTIFDIGDATGDVWLDRRQRLYLRGSGSLAGITKLDHDGSIDRALRAAHQGDGRLLLDAIRRRFHRWNDADLIAVMPRVTNREAFARELPHRGIDNYVSGEYVFGNAINAFVRRELLEAVGATSEAKQWDEVYRRFDRVLRDRQKLVALVLHRR